VLNTVFKGIHFNVRPDCSNAQFLQVIFLGLGLTDSHIDQMLWLLEREVRELHPTQDIHFIDTLLVRKVLNFYTAERNGSSTYEPSGPYFWQVLARSLRQQAELVESFTSIIIIELLL
jgi:hypothetical protein